MMKASICVAAIPLISRQQGFFFSILKKNPICHLLVESFQGIVPRPSLEEMQKKVKVYLELPDEW